MFFKVKNYATLQEALEGLCDFLVSQNVGQESIFDSKLVACELLGNVLKYAKGEAGLRGEIKEDFIELKVLSESFFALPDKIECSGLFAESGRGLFLVNTLCEEQVFAEKDGILARIRIKK